MISVSIISFLTVFLQNLYFRWPSILLQECNRNNLITNINFQTYISKIHKHRVLLVCVIQRTWRKCISQMRDMQRRKVMNENRNNKNKEKSDVSCTVLISDWINIFFLNSKRQASSNAFGGRSFAERRPNESRYWKWTFHLYIHFCIFSSFFWKYKLEVMYP